LGDVRREQRPGLLDRSVPEVVRHAGDVDRDSVAGAPGCSSFNTIPTGRAEDPEMVLRAAPVADGELEMSEPETDTRPMLHVGALNKVYETSGGGTEAIRDLTFDIQPGEIVCIVGPS